MRRTRFIGIFTIMQDEDDDRMRCLPGASNRQTICKRMMVPKRAPCIYNLGTSRDSFCLWSTRLFGIPDLPQFSACFSQRIPQCVITNDDLVYKAHITISSLPWHRDHPIVKVARSCHCPSIVWPTDKRSCHATRQSVTAKSFNSLADVFHVNVCCGGRIFVNCRRPSMAKERFGESRTVKAKSTS